MITICILGVGKVGEHLIKQCLNYPDIHLTQVYNRSNDKLKPFKGIITTTQSVYELKKADIYIVALSDDAIQQIDLNHLQGLVVHTSGTVPFTALKAKKRGVLYPLQSFSKAKNIDFKWVPLCVETAFEKDAQTLLSFAQIMSDHVQYMDEQKRKKLHLAAVFANNFSNRMIGIAYDICKTNNIEFGTLQPLIQETFLKTQVLPPNVAQTGPAVRQDENTIKEHLSQLTDTDKEVYQILTKSIQQKHHAEL